MADTRKIAAAVLIIIAFFLVVRRIASPEPASPKDWVGKEVDIGDATGGRSYMHLLGQQYYSKEMDTAFVHDGLYLGNHFTDEYAEGGKARIRFTANLDPGNGVLEGYMFEKLEEGKPVVYIFLDEEWKRLGLVNIIWGEDFEHSRPFSFNPADEGIYYDMVEDDPGRFSEGYDIHYSGVVVGKVTAQALKDKGTALDSAIMYMLS